MSDDLTEDGAKAMTPAEAAAYATAYAAARRGNDVARRVVELAARDANRKAEKIKKANDESSGNKKDRR